MQNNIKRKSLLKLLFLFLLMAVSTLLYSEENIVSLIERVGGELLWDPVLERGIVNRGRNSVVFQVSLPYLLKDFNRIVDIDPPRRDSQGRVMVTDTAAESFIQIFSANTQHDGFFISTIIIDPGHGGKDPGTIGTHTIGGKRVTLEEKSIVLDVAVRVNALLKKRYPDKNILMTREDDRYLALEERTDFANAIDLAENEAMIFLSIHANASLNSKATGFEVWYLPPEYRREVIDPDELDGDQKNIAPILNSILEEEFTVESILLAREILKGMDSTIGDQSGNRGLKEESWFVVRNARMPSVLAEIGFVTNPSEAALLNNSPYLQKVSAGIYNGLSAYIEQFEKGGE